LRIGVGVKASKHFQPICKCKMYTLCIAGALRRIEHRDTFDFRQAYLRLDISKTTTFSGKAELRFGDERLIGISDWTNTTAPSM